MHECPLVAISGLFSIVRLSVRFTPESRHSDAQERLGLNKRTSAVLVADKDGIRNAHLLNVLDVMIFRRRQGLPGWSRPRHVVVAKNV